METLESKCIPELKYYGKEKSLQEEETSLKMISTLPKLKHLVWELRVMLLDKVIISANPHKQIKDSSPDAPRYVASVSELGFDSESRDIGYTSFATSQVSEQVENIFKLICKAACFPLINRKPMKPAMIYAFGDISSGILSELTKLLNKEKIDIEYREEKCLTVLGKNCNLCRDLCQEAECKTCASCLAVNYCSELCRNKDLDDHRAQCSLMKKALSDIFIGTEESSLDVFALAKVKRENSVNTIKECLSKMQTKGFSLWDFEIISSRFKREDNLIYRDLHPNGMELGKYDLHTLDKIEYDYPLGPYTVRNWPTLFRALKLPESSFHPLIFTNILTIYYILTNLIEIYARVTPNMYFCIHVVVPSQSEIELSFLCEILKHVLPMITIDIFFISPEISAIPLHTKLNSNKTSTYFAECKSHSQEFRNEKLKSTIRIHIAKSRYSEFPVKKYKPNLVLGIDAAEKSLQDSSISNIISRLSELKISSFCALTFRDALSEESFKLSNPKLKIVHKNKKNPFAQPWAGYNSSVNYPCYLNRVISLYQVLT